MPICQPEVLVYINLKHAQLKTILLPKLVFGFISLSLRQQQPPTTTSRANFSYRLNPHMYSKAFNSQVNLILDIWHSRLFSEYRCGFFSVALYNKCLHKDIHCTNLRESPISNIDLFKVDTVQTYVGMSNIQFLKKEHRYSLYKVNGLYQNIKLTLYCRFKVTVQYPISN